MIIIFIELCRIADSLLWIPKSWRRTSTLITMESQQLHQNPHSLHYEHHPFHITNYPRFIEC
ncbi:Y55_G0002150.mRNA.1.CDS.1 [Saccharomyces cerevisiae]|nr:Y55_G0002150.mRNA.1.CDS.1 [Saccharomyces cerevisiae]